MILMIFCRLLRAGRYFRHILISFAVLMVADARASTILKSGTFAGMKVDYKVVLPNGFDPARAYPAVLAFASGPQNMRMVDIDLKGYWAEEAERRGYIVISPAAPTDQLFFENNDKIFPEFLDMILRDYKVLGGKMHVAGPSSGGISAFHVATLYPKYFWSVTVFPGYLDDTTDPMVEQLKPICIYMYVGERDKDWEKAMKQQSQLFERKGSTVKYSIEEDQGHELDLGPDELDGLFDDLEAASKGCGKK